MLCIMYVCMNVCTIHNNNASYHNAVQFEFRHHNAKMFPSLVIKDRVYLGYKPLALQHTPARLIMAIFPLPLVRGLEYEIG